MGASKNYIKRLDLTESSKNLLNFTAGDLIPLLEKKTKLTHVKQQAFEYYSATTKELFQVHITVTRDETDFLEFLEVEEMTTHKSNITKKQ